VRWPQGIVVLSLAHNPPPEKHHGRNLEKESRRVVAVRKD
jgi:hypothetical protein